MRGLSEREGKEGYGGGGKTLIMPIDLLGNTSHLLLYPLSHTSDPLSIPPLLQRGILGLDYIE